MLDVVAGVVRRVAPVVRGFLVVRRFVVRAAEKPYSKPGDLLAAAPTQPSHVLRRQSGREVRVDGVLARHDVDRQRRGVRRRFSRLPQEVADAQRGRELALLLGLGYGFEKGRIIAAYGP